MKRSAKKVAMMGMMLAIIMILSTLEHMLPPLPFLPPNVKLGLSNIVTMYCLFFMSPKDAFVLAALKSVFVFSMRGAVAFALSLCGGLLSIAVILLLSFVFRHKISYVILSISGAIAHNLGQIVVVAFILQVNFIPYYLPILIVAGVVMGSVTGVLLKVVMPVFDKVLK